MKKTKRYNIPAVNRAIDIIELMIVKNRVLSLSEIVKSLDIPKPSLIRILNTLCDRGLIQRSGKRGDYQLKYELQNLRNYIKIKKLCSIALPHMKILSHETVKTIELSSRDRDQMVVYEQVIAKEGIQTYSRIGSSYPYFHAIAAGKIYLAEMNPERRSRILKIIGLPSITQYTISDIDELEADLLAIRKHGYAIENQELRLGVRRVAAPIFDNNKLLGTIHISSTTYDFDISEFEKMGYMAIETAALIGKEISKE